MSDAITIRDVLEGDLPIFYEQQLDPEAIRMANFPSRDHDAFMAHWQKITCVETNVLKTIVSKGEVAGNVVSWLQDEKREIGYWLGREHWGKGIATAALLQFLSIVTDRPLHACVASGNLASIRVLEKSGFLCVEQLNNSDNELTELHLMLQDRE